MYIYIKSPSLYRSCIYICIQFPSVRKKLLCTSRILREYTFGKTLCTRIKLDPQHFRQHFSRENTSGDKLRTSDCVTGVTTMLNFFTTSNGFRGTLPVVSNLTAMNVWDGVCMCFIYASLLEFVCVNYVGRKRPMHNVVYRPGENPVTQVLC